jgi:hypothetical protein
MAVGERIGMLKQRRKAHGLRNPARAGSAKLRLPPIQASETLALPFRKIASLSLWPFVGSIEPVPLPPLEPAPLSPLSRLS